MAKEEEPEVWGKGVVTLEESHDGAVITTVKPYVEMNERGTEE